jgi:hypothetical protein
LQGYQAELNNILNEYLAFTYGIDAAKQKEKYAQWLASHQPFHWFAEFYEIIQGKGGFDVIIGNPPYVELKDIKNYNINNLHLSDCGNIYAMIIYRSSILLSQIGIIGMIVPLSLTSSKRMKRLQQLILAGNESWISNYEGGSNPSVMFNGVKQNLSILIWKQSKLNTTHTTKIYRFFMEEREVLFQQLVYTALQRNYIEYGIPKISDPIATPLLNKLFDKEKMINHIINNSSQVIYIHRIASYYIKCFTDVPYFCNDRDGVKKSEDYKTYYFDGSNSRYVSILSSSIFYIYWIIFYDLFKAGKYAIENFPVGELNDYSLNNKLEIIGHDLMTDILLNSKRINVYYKNTGNVSYDQFFPRLSKYIMDLSDKILASHYGFTEEELDFIINYDIKYRMGNELNEEE